MDGLLEKGLDQTPAHAVAVRVAVELALDQLAVAAA